MPVSAPFSDTKSDGQGNAVAVEVQAEQPKRGRRKKVVGNRMFAIHANEGCFICGEDELATSLVGKTEAEVYLLEKKVKSITVVPGKRNLLTGETEKDATEIVLD